MKKHIQRPVILKSHMVFGMKVGPIAKQASKQENNKNNCIAKGKRLFFHGSNINTKPVLTA